MPRTIIGLDISDDAVAAVQVKSLMQGYQIVACITVPLTEAGDIGTALRGVLEKIDPKGSGCNSVIEDGQVSFRNLQMPFTDLRKIRQTINFELETLMAAPIEGQLIDFIDVDRSDSQTDLIAASVKRDYIRKHLAVLESSGLEPEVLDVRNVTLATQVMKQENSPEKGMLLSLGSKACSILLYRDKNIVLLRHLPFNGGELTGIVTQASQGETVNETVSDRYEAGLVSLGRSINLTLRGFQVEAGVDLHPEKVYVTGPGALLPQTLDILGRELKLPVVNLDLLEGLENVQMGTDLQGIYSPALMDNALALALRDAKKSNGFNFRREEFQLKTQFVKIRKELIRASIYLGIIFILLAVNFSIDYRYLKKRNVDLDNQIEKIFTQTFPEVTNVVDPLHQMKTKINELKSESGGAAPGINTRSTILVSLNDISERIPPELEINVDRMVADQDGIQIRGTTDTFNTVDAIKKSLEVSDKYRDVVIASANLDKSGKGVRFEIKMARTP